MTAKALEHKNKLDVELKRIKDVIVSSYYPEKIILFGSLANADVSEASDIDLLVIKETPSRYWDRIDEIMRLIHPKEALDVFVFTPQEIINNIFQGNVYLEDILSKGRTIYEKAN